MKNYLDYFLEQRVNSADGEEIKGALEAISIEEKKCLELFKIQISHCQQQLALIGERITAGWHTHELMVKKRAFEEQEYVLNVAAQIQQCSYETKGKQSFRAVLCTLIYISTFVPNLNFGQDEHKRRRQVLCLNGSQIPNRVQKQEPSGFL